MEKIKVQIDKDIKDLIPDFIEARRNDFQRLPGLVAQKNYEQMITIGHGMRGSGGGYGFDEITRIGGVIEDAARCQNDQKILEMVKDLESYLSRIEIEYV